MTSTTPTPTSVADSLTAREKLVGTEVAKESRVALGWLAKLKAKGLLKNYNMPEPGTVVCVESLGGLALKDPITGGRLVVMADHTAAIYDGGVNDQTAIDAYDATIPDGAVLADDRKPWFKIQYLIPGNSAPTKGVALGDFVFTVADPKVKIGEPCNVGL
jgi:hypothetical protein